MIDGELQMVALSAQQAHNAELRTAGTGLATALTSNDSVMKGKFLGNLIATCIRIGQLSLGL